MVQLSERAANNVLPRLQHQVQLTIVDLKSIVACQRRASKISDVDLFKKSRRVFHVFFENISLPRRRFQGSSFFILVGRDEKRTPRKTHALEATKISELKTGTPNENIVQKHLNTALLNVFQYLNDRQRHIFIRKLQGSKLTFSKISARKKGPENSR